MSEWRWDSAEADALADPGEAAAPSGRRPPFREDVRGFVSLRTIRYALRRGRRLWASAAVVGVLAGATISLALPRDYSATATILLAHQSGADPADAMATDVALLTTRAVALQVVRDLHLRTSATDFLSHVSADTVSDEVLKVTVTSSSPRSAVQETSVLVGDYLKFRSTQLSAQQTSLTRALDQQATALKAKIATETKQIASAGTGSGSGTSASPDLTRLVSQRTNDSAQLATVYAALASAQASTSAMVSSSRMIDAPTALPVGALKTTAVDSASGLVAGLLVGLLAVMTPVVISDRARTRREVSSALGAPVRLSIERHSSLPTLRRSVTEPTRDTDLVVAHLSGRPESVWRTPRVIAVVSIDSDVRCADYVAALVTSIAQHGDRVLVTDLSEKRLLAQQLQDVSGSAAVLGPGAVEVVPAEATSAGSLGKWAENDAIVVFAAIDIAVGAEELATWAKDAVVVVTAGRTDVTAIRSVAELLTVAGIRIVSAILLDADPLDDTVGTAVGDAVGGAGVTTLFGG